jgi:MFS family permease
VGIALAVVLFAAILAVVGTSMFLGEWLLGSLGWGVLHGTLLFAAIAVACALAAMGISGGAIARAFVVGLLVAVVFGVVMGLALPNRAYASVGEAALPGIEPGIRPLLVGVLILGAIGLVLGVIAAARGGGIGAFVGGVVGGAILGALSAVNVGPQVGVGIGIALGYLVWITLMVAEIARNGVDTDELKSRFYPKETIETSKETLAWLQSKMPPGIGS